MSELKKHKTALWIWYDVSKWGVRDTGKQKKSWWRSKYGLWNEKSLCQLSCNFWTFFVFLRMFIYVVAPKFKKLSLKRKIYFQSFSAKASSQILWKIHFAFVFFLGLSKKCWKVVYSLHSNRFLLKALPYRQSLCPFFDMRNVNNKNVKYKTKFPFSWKSDNVVEDK